MHEPKIPLFNYTERGHYVNIKLISYRPSFYVLSLKLCLPLVRTEMLRNFRTNTLSGERVDVRSCRVPRVHSDRRTSKVIVTQMRRGGFTRSIVMHDSAEVKVFVVLSSV